MPEKPKTFHEVRSMGGRAAAAKLSPEQRSERARVAACARWEYVRRFREVLAEINAELDGAEAGGAK